MRGENSVKIIGPDLEELESRGRPRGGGLADASAALDDVGVYRIMGQSNLMLPIDRRKCARWNLKVGDVQAVGETAVGGKPFSQMIEGERSFDITLRFPKAAAVEPRRDPQDSRRRGGNTVASSQTPGQSRHAGERRQQRALVHGHERQPAEFDRQRHERHHERSEPHAAAAAWATW